MVAFNAQSVFCPVFSFTTLLSVGYSKLHVDNLYLQEAYAPWGKDRLLV